MIHKTLRNTGSTLVRPLLLIVNAITRRLLYPLTQSVEEESMRQRKVFKTTLGDLIAAVTDEVMPVIRDPAGAYVVVSWVLKDVLTRQHVRDHKRLRAKYQG
jgi:hypothetical protein